MQIELKTKVNLAMSVALAALAGMAWHALKENQHLTKADRWVSHTHAVLEASASFRSHLSEASIARRMFLQGDSKQFDVVDVAANACLSDFDTLRTLTTDNQEQQRRLNHMEALLRARLSELSQSIDSHAAARHDDTFQNKLSDQSIGVVAQLAEQTREFEGVEKELLRQRSAKEKEDARQTSRDDVILGLSVCCFVVVSTVQINSELSRRRHVERAIAEQKSMLQSILDTCNDAIIVADNTGKIILRNPAALRMHSDLVDRVGEDAPHKLGLYKSDGVSLFSYVDLPLHRALEGEHADNVEICLHPKCETTARWALASSRPLISQTTILGAVVFYRDITERKELENTLAGYTEQLKSSNLELQKAHAALERLASADELTGLHNRRGFLALAGQSSKLARRSQKPFVLVFVDLDGLKNINDTLGHSAGDQAINDAAHILSDSFRHCDVLGRLGGDEFAILMTDADDESARIVKQRLTDKVAKFNAEVKRSYVLSLSIGMLTCNCDETAPLDDLLSTVDSLMYEEKKRKGANREASVRSEYCRR